MYDTEQSSLRDYLRIIFKHKIMIVTIVIVTIVTVNIGLEMRTPRFEASVKMYVKGMKQTEAEYYKGIHGDLYGGHVELVHSSAVIDRVIKALNLDERPLDYEKGFSSKLKAALIDHKFKGQMLGFEQLPPEEKQSILYNAAYASLQSSLAVFFSGEGSVFTIHVTDFSPAQAARIANSLSRSYVIFDLEQQILELGLKYGGKNATVRQLENYIKDFEKYLDGRILPALDAIGPASVKIIEQAKSGVRIFERPSKSMARVISFIMSLALGVLLAFGLDFYDHTIKSPKDIESFLGLTFLGSIPNEKSKNKLLVDAGNPRQTAYAESYKKLSHKLFMMMKEKNQKTLLMTDAEGSGDTAYVIANLATCLSREAGQRVLIIDADLSKPSIHGVLNTDNSPGLSDVVEEKVPFEGAIQNLNSNLYVLPAGDNVPNPVNLLSSHVTSEVINKAREQFDIVFIYCADMKKCTDAVILSSVADGLVLVFNEGSVKHQIIKHALIPLEEKKINIIGAVINNRKYYIPELIYRIT